MSLDNFLSINASFFTSNTTKLLSLSSESCQSEIRSFNFNNSTRKINIFATVLIIVVGLIGNGLAVFVFAQRRFRLHSSSIYLLFLAISDGLFLMTHFFEDTLRTYIDTYLTNTNTPNCLSSKNPIFTNNNQQDSYNTFMRSLNITDHFNFACRLVNFFRYFLRFFSAYIIVVFTIQRAIAINSPFFQKKFDSKSFAWLIVLLVIIVGLLLNVWVPFLFSNQTNNNNNNNNNETSASTQYCDIKKSQPQLYFIITITYIILIMLVPICVIFICNSLIIYKICKAEKKREGLVNSCGSKIESNCLLKTSLSQSVKELAPMNSRSFYLNFRTSTTCESVQNLKWSYGISNGRVNSQKFASNLVIRPRSKTNDSQKITRMLLLMSLSYAILNLPYFVSWCLFFNEIAFNKNEVNVSRKNYLFACINLTEVFYVLNYGIHFFIYCASGRRFRTQLKNSFKPKF